MICMIVVLIILVLLFIANIVVYVIYCRSADEKLKEYIRDELSYYISLSALIGSSMALIAIVVSKLVMRI